jgi:hypothetical protein
MANRARQLARRKAKRQQKRNSLLRLRTMGLRERMQRAAAAPVLDSTVFGRLVDHGMGQLVFSRELHSGDVAVAVFLLDRYCLGVKDAFGRVMSRSERSELLDRLHEFGVRLPLDPPTARRLVEDAVAYGRNLGFEPHPDYSRVQPIFGDVDPQQAKRTFEFGKDGKPFFVAGRHDSPARCLRIINQLRERCGEGGSHYLVPADPTDFFVDGFDSGMGDDEV